MVAPPAAPGPSPTAPAAPFETRSTCPYCGVGCGVLIGHDGRQILDVRGDPAHPANFGRLCTKGSTLHLTASAAITERARLQRPLRRAARGGVPVPVDWDTALDEATARLADAIGTHGPDSVGFYLSGQLLTEDYYVYNKLVKGLIGSNNVDTNSRLCMSSAATGYKLTLGADAPPCSYEDLDQAERLFIVGSNAAYAHPILYRRLEDARRARPSMKVVVVDPRRTETAEMADLHLQILPGSDVALFHGMLHLLLWEDRLAREYIAAHTTGFEALRDRVREYTPQQAAKLCGITEADLVQAARWFADGPTLSLYCQGLNQSSAGSAKNAALINLHLATGQIGRPGAGPFSLTGQPNAMGGREVGGMSTLLSAHRELSNAAHRAEVAALWGVEQVPALPGLTAVEMFEAAADGALQVLWIVCTNPAQSMPHQAMVRRALERTPYVVVQEAYASTETTRHADLLLPAASWGEKDGTVTNSERRISRVRPAVPPPGEARADWVIGVDLARRLEARLRPGRPTLFPYDTPESIWNEHRESTRGRDLDITGLDYARLDQAPAQWPWPAGADGGRARLYGDGRFPTDDGRARFHAAAWTPLAEPRDARYPYSLISGRLRDQWHGMSRTGTLGRLYGHVPEPQAELHPTDMARLRLAEGDLVQVASRRGAILIPARGSPQLQPAQVSIAMHWGGEVLGGHGGGAAAQAGTAGLGVNALTTDASCPLSRQPELKHAAVKLTRAELPWRLLAMGWFDEADALAARAALQPLMASFAYACCVPFGRDRSGVLFRAADAVPPDAALLERIEALFALDRAPGRQVLSYVDARRGQRRSLRLRGDAADLRVDGLLLAGDTRAESWLRPLLQDQLPAQAYGRLLLLPGATPPVALADRGRQVCTCFDVSDRAIEAALPSLGGAEDARLAALQSALKCGTNCGSCIPELRRLIRLHPVAA